NAPRGVVLGDRTADHDARPTGQTGQDGVEDLAADVIEVDVNPVGGGLAQRSPDVLCLVVDGGVEAEIVGEPATLLLAAGNADHAAALDLGDLPGDVANGAGCPGDDDRLPLLQLGDVEQAEVRGQ